MPKIETVSTTLKCDLCGYSDTHVAGTDPGMATTFFFERHRWLPVGIDEYACPRCAPTVELIQPGQATTDGGRKLTRR